jgi:hypothetical protein|mmetsp:Transcript_56348/g.125755  ORF Transcript_56348/g.125755 Transcript_56348/m.125755 type:complete len:101 (-) Transcript_56348:351-653(-)
MLYFGYGGGSGAAIMAAFSTDLIHWEKDPTPLYKPCWCLRWSVVGWRGEATVICIGSHGTSSISQPQSSSSRNGRDLGLATLARCRMPMRFNHTVAVLGV